MKNDLMNEYMCFAFMGALFLLTLFTAESPFGIACLSIPSYIMWLNIKTIRILRRKIYITIHRYTGTLRA